MATDCKRLSKNARAIFAKFERFYPPNPWKAPQWKKVGKVYDNGWYDLRKAADRTRLEKWNTELIGVMMVTQASSYKTKKGSLGRFNKEHIPMSINRYVEVVLIIRELDFQIETQDLIDGVHG